MVQTKQSNLTLVQYRYWYNRTVHTMIHTVRFSIDILLWSHMSWMMVILRLYGNLCWIYLYVVAIVNQRDMPLPVIANARLWLYIVFKGIIIDLIQELSYYMKTDTFKTLLDVYIVFPGIVEVSYPVSQSLEHSKQCKYLYWSKKCGH